tara:strand:- start:4038 stop:4868 length:831 start_codon:yes stop_codon:yes gene_type:complete
MKAKHNKKRNTAFLFEALARELTKALVSKDKKKTQVVKSILKEHFRRGMVLFSELDCFNTLANQSELDQYTAEKMVFRAKNAYDQLNQQDIFKEQSAVIKKINKDLSKEVYNNFIPNYQSIASVAQIFNQKLPIKNRVLIERKIIKQLTNPPTETEDLQPIDNLVVKSFTERFNKTYGDLLVEQRDLLSKYITSFHQSGADFRLFIGKELKRIHEEVTTSLKLQEVRDDTEMVKNTKKVLERIEKINVSTAGEEDILKVLKLQKLVREYRTDATKN